MKKLTDGINQNHLIYSFEDNSFRKRFDDFNNSIELF